MPRLRTPLTSERQRRCCCYTIGLRASHTKHKRLGLVGWLQSRSAKVHFITKRDCVRYFTVGCADYAVVRYPSVGLSHDVRTVETAKPELDVGPILLTRPNPTHKRSEQVTRPDPTRPKIKIKLWTREPTRPILHNFLVVQK